jgi:hypothetical protein
MNLLNKFLHGDYKLFVSYWIISAPTFVVLKLLYFVIGPTPGSPLAVIWVVSFLVLALIAAVGIWNSATKYQGFSLLKYIAKLHCITSVILVVAVLVISFDEKIPEIRSGGNITVDFLYPINSKDCNSPYPDKPTITVEFIYEEKNKSIFAKTNDPNSGKSNLKKFDNCEVIDSKNWYCGGIILAGGVTTVKYQVVDGKFSYDNGINPYTSMCPPKVNVR